jgi:hypothetical protein
MRFFALLILTLTVCVGCQKSATAQLREKLHTVTLADGVSQLEAQIICECYFAKEVGCGAFSGVHDGGDRWIVDAKLGYGGEPAKGFYIIKIGENCFTDWPKL